MQTRTLSVAAICVDDTTFTYQGTNVCEYVRSRTETQRRNLCKEYRIVEEKCPVSCSLCCDDDPSLLYNGSPACDLLASLADAPQQEYCEEYAEASFSCPVTCNTCPLPFEMVCEWEPLGSQIVGEDIYSQSGESISTSANGKILAIGAAFNTPGGDYSIYQAGHVRVYLFDEGGSNDWVQMGNDIDGDFYCGLAGDAVSLSDDGLKVAVGAPHANNDAGQVQVYSFDEAVGDWVQLGGDLYGEYNNDQFGYSVSLSSDGKTIAVGATKNSGFADSAGRVRVYYYDEESLDWIQLGNNIDGEAAFDNFGVYTHLSPDGKTVSVSAFRESPDAIVRVYSFDEPSMEWKKLGNDIGSEEGDSWFGMSYSSVGNTVAVGDLLDENGVGAVKVLSYDETSSDWLQMGSDIDGESNYDFFGIAVSLSGDGMIVAVGAPRNAGSVQVYNFDEASMDWVQMGDELNGQNGENFGRSLSISSDGQSLAVGAMDYDCSTGRVKVFKYVCD